MPPRLPQSSDFPTLTTTTTPPPSTRPHLSNILILLHGLGDTLAPYTSLAQQLNLPETAVLSIQGPAPLPFDLGGFHWGDDVIFDANGGLDPDAGFDKARGWMREVLEGLGKCGWSPREIVLWGVGQGGSVALAAGLLELGKILAAGSGNQGAELGGIVSLGGALPSGTSVSNKSRTQVLVCGGAAETQVPDEKVERVKASYEFVEKARWKRKGDGMPRVRDEMMPIMRFLARRLRSRAGVPEGSVELA